MCSLDLHRRRAVQTKGLDRFAEDHLKEDHAHSCCASGGEKTEPAAEAPSCCGGESADPAPSAAAKTCCGSHREGDHKSPHHDHAHHHHGEVKPTSGAKYFCPMCPGVESDKPGDCPKCGMALERNPMWKAVAKTIYTCPMHPEIEQDHPGDCPKCGMTLVLKNVVPEDEAEDDHELVSLQHKLWISAGLALPVRALGLSRDVMKNIRQNLFFAIIYNAVGVPLAAGLLYPFTGWLLNPMVARAAMAMSSVSVIDNALRLRHREEG